MPGVFTTKVNPTYDDLPEVRYHFPKTYLNQVSETINHWVVYYEPRRQDDDPDGRSGRQAYFATAMVERIEPDPLRENHYYAFMKDYLEFESEVPFRFEGRTLERKLQKPDGSTSKGAFGRAVRLIENDEYQTILGLGFPSLKKPERIDDVDGQIVESEVRERPIVERLMKRLFRDIAFSKNVGVAYDFTCAMTGIKIIDGGGRCEIEAAHIRPIGDGHNGPDSLRNGVALSRTFHWMFDRGLLSIADNYEILVAGKLVPDAVKRLINPTGTALVPADRKNQPHAQFLQYHRECIFKG